MQWVTVRTHLAFWEMASAHRVQLIWPSHTMLLAVACRMIQHGKRKCRERNLILLAAISTADISTEDVPCFLAPSKAPTVRDLFSVELSDMNGLHERMNDACATVCIRRFMRFTASSHSLLISSRLSECHQHCHQPIRCAFGRYTTPGLKNALCQCYSMACQNCWCSYGPSYLNIGLHTFTIRWTRWFTLMKYISRQQTELAEQVHADQSVQDRIAPVS